MGYFARRLLAALLLVFAVSSGALILAQLAPGDFASSVTKSPEQIAADRHRLGLDRPFAEQYATWVRRAIALPVAAHRVQIPSARPQFPGISI